MDEMEFTEAESNMNDLISEYQQYQVIIPFSTYAINSWFWSDVNNHSIFGSSSLGPQYLLKGYWLSQVSVFGLLYLENLIPVSKFN